jgi:site-specific DNA-methyltransferase (adenine-specific)
VPFQDKGNLTRGARGKNGDLRCQGNVWHIPYETIKSKSEKGSHPAIFPVELARRCLKLCALPEGAVILDPFCGTGTVMLAARELGLSGIGIDVDEQYLDYARERLGGLTE